MREKPTGELLVRPPAGLAVLLMAGGVGAAVVFGAIVAHPGPADAWRSAAIPLAIAFAGWLMLVFRSQLRIDPRARRYHWRPGRPWQTGIAGGDLDADAVALLVAVSPCGGKRQCTSGYEVTLRFRNAVGDVELTRRHVREDAEDEARRLSGVLNLPIAKDHPHAAR